MDSALRLNILAGSFAPYVAAFVAPRYKEPTVRKKVISWISSSPNIMQALCDLACKVYKKSPTRELKGAKVRTSTAYRKVLKEARWNVKAKMLERRVYAANVAIVVPVVRMGQLGPVLHYDTLLPHATEIDPDPSDPWGSPRAACWELPSPHVVDGPKHAAILDKEAYHFYEDDKLVRTVPHNAGVFPGVAFRLRESPALNDWWDSARGEAVVQHQLMAAHILARMRYVRHGQDRKKEFVVAEGIDKLPFQVAGAEGAIEFPIHPSEFEYIVQDVNTSIDEHSKHMRLELREAARSMGFPPDLIDFDPGTEAIESIVAQQQHATLADMRDDAIDFFDVGEHELAYKTALVLRGANHPAARLIEPSEIYDRFTVKWPDLTFVEHPKVRLEVAKMRIDLGVSSVPREYAAMHDIPFEEARAEVVKIAEEEIEIGSMFAEHNVSRVADDRHQNLAQLQGRQGGLASGETRKNENNEDGEHSSSGRGERNTDERGRGRRDSRDRRRGRR